MSKSSFTFVHEGKLYYVEDGKAMCIEDHYKNTIEEHGKEVLDEMHSRHHSYPDKHPSRYPSDSDQEVWGDATDNDQQFSKKQAREMRNKPIIRGQPRDEPTPLRFALLGFSIIFLIVLWVLLWS